jgi:transposase
MTSSSGVWAKSLYPETLGSRADIFFWIDQNRRMSKDYERLTESSEAFIYVAMSRLMVRRLARF